MYASIPRVEHIDSIEVHHPRYIVTPKVGRSMHGLLLFLALSHYIRKNLKSFRPDIILCYWAYPDGFANALLSKFLNVPVIIGCLGSDINLHTKYFLKKKLIAWSLNHAEKTLVVSNAMRQQVLSLGVADSKIKVIPNGVDTNIFYPAEKKWAREKLNLKTDSKIIVYIGRLSDEKGPDILIEAFSRLPELQKRLLVIVGSGKMQNSCHTLASALGVHESVKFAGERPNHEVPLWLNAADVVCLPSLREGWPNVVMEALACGRPVVASNVGGVPEILTSEDLGILAEPGNPADLAAKLDRAIRSAWKEEVLKARINGWTWESAADEVRKELQLAFLKHGHRE